MSETRRFVYVARLREGDEVPLRRLLEHLPDGAIAAAGMELASYVGSGFCVLQFAVPGDDFQAQAARYLNDPSVREFHRGLAEHLVAAEQIAQAFSAGDPRFHPGLTGTDGPTGVTTAELPLAAEVSRYPRTG